MGAMIAQRAEYLREVKKELACPWRERRRLLRRAEQAVDAFLEENPEAGQDDWYAALGAPEDMAGELLTSYDTGEIKRIRPQTAAFSESSGLRPYSAVGCYRRGFLPFLQDEWVLCGSGNYHYQSGDTSNTATNIYS